MLGVNQDEELLNLEFIGIERYSNLDKLIRVTALILKDCNRKSFKSFAVNIITWGFGFGPILVKDVVKKRSKLKCYGVIFICLTTRAIH